MTETATAHPAKRQPLLTREQWGVVGVCCLASCAKEMEPPIWVFRPPPTSAFNLGWVQVDFLLSLVAMTTIGFILLGGVLGDLYGRRRVLLIGLGGLIASNLLLFLSPDLPWFLGTRFAAGAFGALVLPLSLSLLMLALADHPRARALAIAVYIIVIMAAYFASLLLGQVMYHIFDFRAVFVAPTLCAIAAIPLARRLLTDSRIDDWRRFDAVGHAAWALFLLAVTYGVTEWDVAGPYAPVVLAMSLLVGAIGLALLVWWDRRTRDSVLAQSGIPRRALAVLMIYGVAMQFGNVGYLTQVRSALIAAYGHGIVLGTVALAPALVGMVVMTLVGSRRLMGLRARPVMAIGLAVFAVIAAATALTGASAVYPVLAVLLFAFGAAMIAASTAWTFVFLRSIQDSLIGVRTGISSSIFQLGSTAGSTVAAALLATFGLANYQQRLEAAGVPAQQTQAALNALNVLLDPSTADASTLPPSVADQLVAGYQLAYIAAYNQVLLIIAAVCLVGSAVVWFALPRRTEGGEFRLDAE